MNKFYLLFLFFLIARLAQAQQTDSLSTDTPRIVSDSATHVIDHTAGTVQPNVLPVMQESVWSFGINGGYSYRLPNAGTRLNTPYSKYLKGLKTGFSIGADVHKYVWRHVGLGLKYNFYHSAGTYDANTNDNISIQFIGPSVTYRSPFANGKTSVLAGFAMGYQSYKNNGRSSGKDVILKSNAAGWAITVGLEQKVSEKLAIHLSGACYLGTSYKMKRKTGGTTETIKLSETEFEELARAEITLGLRLLR